MDALPSVSSTTSRSGNFAVGIVFMLALVHTSGIWALYRVAGKFRRGDRAAAAVLRA